MAVSGLSAFFGLIIFFGLLTIFGMVTTSGLVIIDGLLGTILDVLIIFLVAVTRELFFKDFIFLLDIFFGVFRLFFKSLGLIFPIIPDLI